MSSASQNDGQDPGPNTQLVFRPDNNNDSNSSEVITIDVKIKRGKKVKSIEVITRPTRNTTSTEPTKLDGNDQSASLTIEEKLLSIATKRSLKEEEEKKTANAKESSELEMAIRESLDAAKQYTEEAMLVKAIAESKESSEIEAAMTQSLDTAAQVYELEDDEESMLEKAIALSKEYDSNSAKDDDIEAAIIQSLSIEDGNESLAYDDIDKAIIESLLCYDKERDED